MEYITNRCPHCKKVVSRVNSLTRYSSGNPFRVCPHCGGTYVDTDCTEPALTKYKELGMTACIVVALFNWLFIAFGAMLVIAIGYFGSFYEFDVLHLYLSVGIGAVAAIWLFKSKRAGLKEENKERYRLWQESDARLRNYEYACALKKAGFKVPQEYLVKPAPQEDFSFEDCECDNEDFCHEHEVEKKTHTQPPLETLNGSTDDGLRFCRKCGAPIEQDSIFCSRCGIKVR